MPPPSMSTRTLLAGTNKMSISCGCPHRAGLRPHRRLQLLQHQRLRLLLQLRLQLQRRLRLLQPPRLQPQSLLQPHRRPQLLLLPDQHRRRDLRRRRGRAPRHAHGRNHRALSPRWPMAVPRQNEAATREISNACALRIFQINPVTN
jgi:hypothetical protein